MRTPRLTRNLPFRYAPNGIHHTSPTLPGPWVPDTASHRTKGELALDLIDAALAQGLSPRPVSADSGYGNESLGLAFWQESNGREEPAEVRSMPPCC
ncbi:transposase [Glycomyces sp. L485]|uniref:transposase n=1 Tax=Glycomyces sp. L485 TaxID=2909235 RepID=UPI003219CA85